jgi:hypothetical protein
MKTIQTGSCCPGNHIYKGCVQGRHGRGIQSIIKNQTKNFREAKVMAHIGVTATLVTRSNLVKHSGWSKELILVSHYC